MSKAKIIDKKSVDSILGEKNLLSELHHPFIVNMVYSFQDHDYLYLVMDLLPGGNLRYHLSIKNHFNEKQIKFLIGCIMIGLKYIHGQNILHRDIKPENLVFDSNGYLRITDFGIAKHYVINNKKDTSGTIGYLAPEVLCNVNHNFSIDYYAVGIITYELMYGHRPYLGKTKHEVKQLILTRQAEIDYDDLPNGFSNETADFINKLIQRKPKNRLGKDNINEVIGHPWFNEFDWDNTSKKKLKAPYVPKLGDNFDKKYCLQSNKIGTDTMERYKKIMLEDNYNLVFMQFNCNRIPEELKGYSNKKINENIHGINNNITSNLSTTISRNNKNEIKQNNVIENGHNKLVNNNMISNKISKNKNIDDSKDFDKEIFKQIVTLNKSLHNISVLNKTNSVNNQNGMNNKSNIMQNKTKNGMLYNKSNINLFRNKDNYLNNYNILNKTYRNENNINKRNLNENINNNYLDISSTIKQLNPNRNNNYNNMQKNNYAQNNIMDNENIIFNEKNLIENILNKRIEHPINHNMSMSNLNINKSKKLINNSSIDDQNSILDLNSGILKNMKYQYQDVYPNKRNKFLNYSVKIKNINQNNNMQNNNNDINNENVFYNKINHQIKKNNTILRRNVNNLNINMPKTKKDFIKKEFLKNSTFYNPHQNQNNSNNNISINIDNNNINNNNIHKRSSSTIMSSNIYSKKKNNTNGLSLINSQKRLSSSHSMHNLKANNYNRDVIANNNNTMIKKSNFMKLDKSLKNISIIDKKLPFINMALNKKNGEIGNDIYYILYGKIQNENKGKYKSGNIHYDFLTDRIRNKRIKNNENKINYNNKSVNNFLDSYKKA